MTATIKVLKRKDAASVVVAVIVAMIIWQALPTLTGELAEMISGLDNGQSVSYVYPGAGWQGQYLHPVVSAVLQLVLLDVLIRLYVAVHSMVSKK